MAAELRAAGIRAETYVGNGKFGDQLKYADKRGAAIAVIEGGDERAKGEVTLKDSSAAARNWRKSVESRADWVKDREAQISVPRARTSSKKCVPCCTQRRLRWPRFPFTMRRALPRSTTQADAILGVLRGRGYERDEPSVLQPAEIFLDRSGEEIRRRTFMLTDPAGQ